MSDRDLLAAAIEPPSELVEVPEIGATFLIVGMNGTQRDAFESSLYTATSNGRKRVLDTKNVRAKLLVHTIVDRETRQPLFAENEAEHLGRVRADVLDRLFAVAQRLSGISDRDVETLAKN